jgi:mono/diheme cytochrome c family protein
MRLTTFRFPLATFALLPALLAGAPAFADSANGGISEGFRFSETSGESLYRAVCQSCHMAEGQGAQGAGMYPALAANPKLASGKYPAINVLHGRKGMPSFKHMMNDQQVAAVTNYVRTHMGNDYKDALTAADVKALR